MKISQIVKQYREEHSLSMDEFGKKCGLSKGYISMLENENNPQTGREVAPTVGTLRQLADGMGLDFDELFEKLDESRVNLSTDEAGSLFSKRLKMIRKDRGLSRDEMAAMLGISRKDYVDYEAGLAIPLKGSVRIMAEKLNVPPNILNPDLFIQEVGFPYKPTKRIPILGRISAGMPLYAEQYIEGYTYVDFKDDEEYFGLIVRGDSMNAARIQDGDTVIVRRQSSVNDGEIAAVLVNGEDATIKRFYRKNNVITLNPQSHNPAHVIQVYDDSVEIKVLGRVVRVEINI